MRLMRGGVERMGWQPAFFAVEERLRELSAKGGDGLERIAALVDFEAFRPELERAVPRSGGARGGRPAFDLVLMSKVLPLQAMHALSDERVEYLIKDRLSSTRFLVWAWPARCRTRTRSGRSAGR